jgi:type IV pilus assembly protein PilE
MPHGASESTPCRPATRPAAPPAARGRRELGFTLIELLIAVVIVGILARIAIPAYSQYILRGQLTNATNGLNAAAAQMEQYFQDNRVYNATGTLSPPCTTAAQLGQFMISCVAPTSGTTPGGMPAPGTTATSYILVAQGGFASNGTYSAGLPTAGFYYTLDNSGNKTSFASATWGSASCSPGWMTREGSCG